MTHRVQGSSTPLTITVDAESGWPSWRIGLGDTPLYCLDIGRCDTCSWWFEREDGGGDPDQAEQLAANLRSGVTALAPDVLEQASRAMPNGSYQVTLMNLAVQLVEPGDPHDYFVNEQVATWGREDFGTGDLRPWDPKGPYYRSPPLPPDPSGEQAFNFLLPLQSPGRLDTTVVEAYADRIRRGERPTALALAVSESRPPHHILAHIILDGHHKLHAAALTGTPVRLVSFVVLRALEVPLDDDRRRSSR